MDITVITIIRAISFPFGYDAVLGVVTFLDPTLVGEWDVEYGTACERRARGRRKEGAILGRDIRLKLVTLQRALEKRLAGAQQRPLFRGELIAPSETDLVSAGFKPYREIPVGWTHEAASLLRTVRHHQPALEAAIRLLNQRGIYRTGSGVAEVVDLRPSAQKSDGSRVWAI